MLMFFLILKAQYKAFLGELYKYGIDLEGDNIMQTIH